MTANHFTSAMQKVGASVVRGVAVQAMKTSWEDIGGLTEVKRRLKQAVEWPLNHSDAFARLGIKAPRGVLLHGPPGKRTIWLYSTVLFSQPWIPPPESSVFPGE